MTTTVTGRADYRKNSTITTSNFVTTQEGYQALPQQSKHISALLNSQGGPESSGVILGLGVGEIIESSSDQQGPPISSRQTTPQRSNLSASRTYLQVEDIKRDLKSCFESCIMEKNRSKYPSFGRGGGLTHNLNPGKDMGGLGRGHGSKDRPRETHPSLGKNVDEFMETIPEENDQEMATRSEVDATMNPDAGNNQWTTVGKPKATMTNAILAKKTLTGAKLDRVLTGDSRISNTDISAMFRLIERIDPNAIIMNHKQDMASAKSISDMAKMAPMDYSSYLDVTSTDWDHPRFGKRKTTLSFWIASDTIGEGLQEIRNDVNFQRFLLEGNASLQSTKLHESRSRIVAYIQGKDPKHTYRNELGNRISVYLQQQTPNKSHIPVHVITTQVDGIRILAIAVGNKDARAVETILTKAEIPFPGPELILHAWKKSNKNEFEERIKQHAMIVQQSQAFKLINVDITNALPLLIASMTTDSEVDSSLVDISTARHSGKSGVVYIQYIRDHRDTVLKALKTYLAGGVNPPGSHMIHQPSIVNEDSSISPTIESGQTKTTITKSKWQGKFDTSTFAIPHPQEQRQPPRIPAAITTKPKSFSQALMASLINNDDESSTLTPQTNNAGGSSKASSYESKKTAREEQLEVENLQLKQQLQQVHTRLESMENSYKEQMQQMQSTIDNLAKQLGQLNRSPPATPDTTPASKKANTQQSPWMGTIQGAVTNVMRTVAPIEGMPPDPATAAIPPAEVGHKDHV